MNANAAVVVNGWTILTHPLFVQQLEELIEEVEKLQSKSPRDYVKKKATKRLAAIFKLVLEVVPQDPSRVEYRQGKSLGEVYKHWFRVKFMQQYRLFFRYQLDAKIILFAWINDDDSKRAYESANDAYKVFRGMLDSGHPPNDWAALLAEAQASKSSLLRRYVK